MHERQIDACEQQPPLRPRIYVASLADYNAGRLHGVWLEADQPADALQAGISGMLADSPEPVAEEFAIHDYDDFAGIRLGEYESLETVARLAQGLVLHGQAFGAFVEWFGSDEATDEAFESHYRGSWENAQAYAEELLTDLGVERYLEDIPDSLRPYVTVDVAGFARDLELGGDIYVAEDDACVHIFETQA